MCSDVINTLISLKMKLIFYQLDQYINFDEKEIKLILKNQKIDFFYFYKSFKIDNNQKLFRFLKKL